MYSEADDEREDGYFARLILSIFLIRHITVNHDDR